MPECLFNKVVGLQLATLLNRNSSTGDSFEACKFFQNRFFCRTSKGDCLCNYWKDTMVQITRLFKKAIHCSWIKDSLREKCPYSEFFWPLFSRIWNEYGEIEWGKIRTRKTSKRTLFMQRFPFISNRNLRFLSVNNYMSLKLLSNFRRSKFSKWLLVVAHLGLAFFPEIPICILSLLLFHNLP